MEAVIASKFELGQVVATPRALGALEIEGADVLTLLRRHALGDWGGLCAFDKAANDQALVDGDRILSAYILPKTGVKIWVITEFDRSYTTLLLPTEY